MPTFLFTDIEGSTRRWDQFPEVMPGVLERHDEIIRQSVEGAAGRLFKHTGDGACAVFDAVDDAIAAAMAAQVAMEAEAWGSVGPIRVRMAVHSGATQRRDGDHFGPTLNRVARLMSAGHGGQVLVSQAAASELSDGGGRGWSLVDLGEYRLRDLEQTERIYQLEHIELGDWFPPLRTASTSVGSLPIDLTPFLGRDHELVTVADALRESRLVTLTGVGGVGKTRLALEAARRASASFGDGAWWVDLAPIGDPADVVAAVGGVLEVRQREGVTIEQRVLDFLGDTKALLVLDNCEHVVGTVAALAATLLQQCPTATILATSREGLAVAGERIVAVPPLALPAQDSSVDEALQSDAIQFFVERARGARPDFAVTDANVDSVRQLCARLDGIPLAIELATARLRSLAPAEILDRLDQRFRMLKGSSRSAIERHQTLRGTIDWSYGLLDPTEQHLFDIVSVFAGTFSSEAVAAVAVGLELDEWDLIDVLTSLVDKSMVVADQVGDATRYALLESLRQYGQEKLDERGESDVVWRRFVEHHVVLAEEADEELRGADEALWAHRLELEMDNIRSAALWALGEADVDLAYRVCGAVAEHALWRERFECNEWARRAVDLPGGEQHPARTRVCGAAAHGAWIGVDLDDAQRMAQLGIDAAEARGEDPFFLNHIVMSAVLFRDWDIASGTAQLEAVVTTAKARGEVMPFAYARLIEIAALAQMNFYDLARPLADDVAEAAQGHANPSVAAVALAVRARAMEDRDPIESDRLLEEALALAVRVDNRWFAAHLRGQLAHVALLRGDPVETLARVKTQIEHWYRVGASLQVGGTLMLAAAALAFAGRDDAAAQLTVSADRYPGEVPLAAQRCLEGLAQRVGAAEYTRLRALGEAMTTDELRRFALDALTVAADG